MSEKTLVFDIGSFSTKCGFSGDYLPISTFPTVIGIPKMKSMFVDHEMIYVGNDVQSRRRILNIKFPIENAININWDYMEDIFQYSFRDILKINSEDYPLLISEPPNNLKRNREEVTQMIFEHFTCPSFYISVTGSLACLSSGKTTGVVLDCGHEYSYSIPVYEGHALLHSVYKSDIGGKLLTEYCSRYILRGYTDNLEVAQDIKEKICSLNDKSQKNFELPDGTLISIGNERYNCPDALFSPKIIGNDSIGIHELIIKSINSCDNELQKELYSNIVLSGGSSLFEGVTERLIKEIPFKLKPKVVSLEKRNFLVWKGGSILASLPVVST